MYSKFYLIGIILTAVAIHFLSACPVFSAEDSSNLAGKEIESKESMSITSKKMVVNNLNRTMIFEGEVKVIKGDMTLTSDRVKVDFLDKKGGKKNTTGSPSLSQREISVIEAEGNVHITRGNREAKADKAEYHQQEEMIVLTGSPEGWDNQYKITGSKMTIYLKEDRSIIDESHVQFNP